jgi:hypothetical protein
VWMDERHLHSRRVLRSTGRLDGRERERKYMMDGPMALTFL